MSGGLRVVAVGGGHGQAMSLRAIRHYASSITAVVAVADDGGSSGRLRDALGIIPPGDLRKCLLALADPDSPAVDLFRYRFPETAVEGHALGNLMLAALFAERPSVIEALDAAGQLLGACGRVLPATLASVTLHAEGPRGPVDGQVAVMAASDIRQISLRPERPDAPDEVLEAISTADQIIIGPGSLYTSVLAAVAVPAITQAITESAAQRIFVANLRAEDAETRGYDVAAQVDALGRHGIPVDVVVCDTSRIDLGMVGPRVVEVALARRNGLAHDPDRLWPVLEALDGERRDRSA